MEFLLQSVKIGINEKIYVKDPESSDLGKRIVEQRQNNWDSRYIRMVFTFDVM